MKKNFPSYDNQINLNVLFQIIWNGKIKVVLITAILFLIGSIYAYQLPNEINNSIVLKHSNNLEKNKLFSLYNYSRLIFPGNEVQSIEKHVSNELRLSEDLNKIILKRFLEELLSNEQKKIILKNNINIKKKISKLTEVEQDKVLLKYATSLQIVKSKQNEDNIILNFKWNNTKEAAHILESIINTASNNVKFFFYNDLHHRYHVGKQSISILDKNRIDYLTEQLLIAKELNISEYTNNLNFDFKNTYNSDYLRGYKALEREIEIIKNRQYLQINFLINQLNSLSEEKINFFDYDISNIEVKSSNNSIKIIILSVLLGLILGIFYTMYCYVIQSPTIYKKK